MAVFVDQDPVAHIELRGKGVRLRHALEQGGGPDHVIDLRSVGIDDTPEEGVGSQHLVLVSPLRRRASITVHPRAVGGELIGIRDREDHIVVGKRVDRATWSRRVLVRIIARMEGWASAHAISFPRMSFRMNARGTSRA